MALTAEDCALLLNAMAGHDAKDATSLQQDQEDYTRYLGLPLQETTPHKLLAGLRIGLPKEYFAEGLSTEVRAAVETAIKVFEELGATCIEVTLPHTHLCVPVYYVIAPAEASSNLARFDGVRYGFCVRSVFGAQQHHGLFA